MTWRPTYSSRGTKFKVYTDRVEDHCLAVDIISGYLYHHHQPPEAGELEIIYLLDRLCSRYITTLPNWKCRSGIKSQNLVREETSGGVTAAAVQCGPGSSLRQLWSEEHDIAVTTVETVYGGVMYNLQPEN